MLQLLTHTAESTVGPAELIEAPVLNCQVYLVSQLLHLHLQHLQLALQHLYRRDDQGIDHWYNMLILITFTPTHILCLKGKLIQKMLQI